MYVHAQTCCESDVESPHKRKRTVNLISESPQAWACCESYFGIVHKRKPAVDWVPGILTSANIL